MALYVVEREGGHVMKKMIGFCGAGPLNIGGAIPAFKKLSCADIMLFVGSNKFNEEKKTVVINGKICYELIPISDEYLLGEKSLQPNQVLYCYKESPYFHDALNSTCCMISDCREGILDYSMLIEKNIKDNSEYDIISIDNNPQYFFYAKEKNRTTNIRYHQGVIHSVVSEINYDEGYINIKAGDSAIITFQPSVKQELIELKEEKSCFLYQTERPIIHIAETEASFAYAKESKLATINAQHTYQIMLAVKKGLEQGECITSIQENSFSKYCSKAELLMSAQELHLITFSMLLVKISSMNDFANMDEAPDYFSSLLGLQKFLRYTYDSKDCIKRGLDVTKTKDVQYKCEHHISLLENALIFFDSKPNIHTAIKLLKLTGLDASPEDFEIAKQTAHQVITVAKKN